MSFLTKNQGFIRCLPGLLLMAFCVSQLHAQTPGLNVKFDNLSIRDGLSQSSPNCILQDSKGFLWIGTEDGLNRYDGYAFEVFKPDGNDPHSISSTRINTLYEDQQGTLWVGTNGGGLNRYDRDGNGFVQPRSAGDSLLFEGQSVHALLMADKEIMLVGTETGLRLFKPAVNQPVEDTVLTLLEHMSITALLRDGNLIWIGTDQGLYRYDLQKRQLTASTGPGSAAGSLPDERITTLARGRIHELWIGTETGVALLDTRQHRLTTPAEFLQTIRTTVKAILTDDNSNVWIATFGAGLYVYETARNTLRHFTYDYNNPYSISNNEVLSLFCDRSGIMWVGSNGLDKYNPRKEKFTLFDYVPYSREKLIFRNIHPIYDDGAGVLWVGSKSDGLHRLDRERNQYQHIIHQEGNPNSLASNHVRAIREYPRGTLWIGTDDMGLTKIVLDNARKPSRFSQFKSNPLQGNSLTSNTIYAIYPAADGKLWIGTDNGLTIMDPVKESFVQYKPDPGDPNSLSHSTVYGIFGDSRGKIWLATDLGVNRFNPAKNGFDHYIHQEADTNSLVHNEILSIMEDRDGNLWIGTYGKGLDKLDTGSDTFIHFRNIPELNTAVIYGILQDEEGILWLSTNNGIMSFNPESRQVTGYTVEDGLQSNEFNGTSYYRSPEGEMFFGGQYGFNSFFPKQVVKDTVPPLIVLTDLQVRNQSVRPAPDAPITVRISEAKEINLNYRENNFTLYFSALHFANPQQNRYKYKLEGFDDDWIDAETRRFVSYTSLPYKTYTFRVIASNSDGTWNQEGLSVVIRIRPPFWATIVFRLFMVVSVTGLAAWLIRKRMQFMQVQKQKLEEQVLENTQHLESARVELETKQEEIVKQKIELKTREKDQEGLLWFNQGLGLFSGIYGKNRNDLPGLCREFISHLTSYVEAQQGCLYLEETEGDTAVLNLKAGYNLNTGREHTRFLSGESYVGTCYLEKRILEVNNLTDTYAILHSGLGSQPLTSLLFAPLMAEDQCIGVIELGSFRKIKGYRIDFVEKILETFSSIIQNERVNESNKKLITQSEQQTRELLEREDQLRQNLEMIMAAREESSLQEEELTLLINESAEREKMLQEEIRNLKEALATVIPPTATSFRFPDQPAAAGLTADT